MFSSVWFCVRALTHTLSQFHRKTGLAGAAAVLLSSHKQCTADRAVGVVCAANVSCVGRPTIDRRRGVVSAFVRSSFNLGSSAKLSHFRHATPRQVVHLMMYVCLGFATNKQHLDRRSSSIVLRNTPIHQTNFCIFSGSGDIFCRNSNVCLFEIATWHHYVKSSKQNRKHDSFLGRF